MYISESDKKCRKEFTKEEIVEEIRNRIKEGKSILARDMRRKNHRFYRDAIQYFGSWEKVIEESGGCWENLYGKKPYGYWTEEKVQEKLKEFIAKGIAVNYRELCTHPIGEELYEAMVYTYGSWEKAVKSIGENPDDFREVYIGDWTIEKIEEVIRGKQVRGESLQPTLLRKEYGKMVKEALKHFGSWKKFYEHFGIVVSEHTTKREHRKWSREVVIREVVKLKENGKPLTATSVHCEDIQLYRNGLKYFGSWKTVLQEL